MANRRILIAKAGLDGHDRGAKYIVHLLRDAGYEVTLHGNSPQPGADRGDGDRETCRCDRFEPAQWMPTGSCSSE